jgi:hypothetical protein
MKYLVSKEEIVEAVEKFGNCHKPLVDILLESKTPVEEIAVSSLLLKEDKNFQLNISPENYVKDCNYYKIYVNHFIQEVQE